MLKGKNIKSKYMVVVRNSNQDLKPIYMGFSDPQELDYIKEVAEETCGTIYDALLERVEVIVDMTIMKVVYTIHKNRKKTISALAQVC